MGYRMIVLAKQVPDTKAITGKAMNADGTVNRAALPAIFNPDDLHALEEALRLKETAGGTVTVLTMGLPKACDVLRAALYLGADEVVLLTDRGAAASDTLATSYILSCAVRSLGNFDIILCGRQAIDGDTAQVGPQVAEKLGMTQITYVQAIEDVSANQIVCRRTTDEGYEIVAGKLPVLLTVTDSANEVRSPSAKRIMTYKKARAPVEIEAGLRAAQPDETPEAVKASAAVKAEELAARNLLIKQVNLSDIEADREKCGRDGSPTKVKRIQSIVLTASGLKHFEPNEGGMRALIHELIEEHAIG